MTKTWEKIAELSLSSVVINLVVWFGSFIVDHVNCFELLSFVVSCRYFYVLPSASRPLWGEIYLCIRFLAKSYLVSK